MQSFRKDGLARGLGWFSVGLGTAQLVAPRAMARFIGARGDGERDWLMRALGARELASGVALLSGRRPSAWLWARFAGDVADLALLGTGLARRPSGPRRMIAASAAVAGVAALDAFAARRAGRRGPRFKAITIRRSPEEVAAMWKRLAGGAEGAEPSGVSFRRAAGGRGTEVAVELRGASAHAVAADLRRLKQILETGEVLRSDASIHQGMHAARPPEPDEAPRTMRPVTPRPELGGGA